MLIGAQLCDIICGTSFSMLNGACTGGMGSMTCSKGGGMSKMKMLGQCGAAAICTGASSMGGSCSLCQYENKVYVQERERKNFFKKTIFLECGLLHFRLNYCKVTIKINLNVHQGISTNPVLLWQISLIWYMYSCFAGISLV